MGRVWTGAWDSAGWAQAMRCALRMPWARLGFLVVVVEQGAERRQGRGDSEEAGSEVNSPGCVGQGRGGIWSQLFALGFLCAL